tara:strand:- start:66 stop:335 length:270 start_codon:yes stop_codon:yes gene_type:complete
MRSLTVEQIIEEIDLASKTHGNQEDDLYTFKELKHLLGLSDGATYKRLDILDAENRLEVGVKMIRSRGVTRTGSRIWRPVTGYRILSSD